MRKQRIKNLVRQDYGFVIQFCEVTELLSVEKEHNSPIELVCNHTQLIDIIETKFNIMKLGLSGEISCFSVSFGIAW
jgi:hypothetical protein